LTSDQAYIIYRPECGSAGMDYISIGRAVKSEIESTFSFPVMTLRHIQYRYSMPLSMELRTVYPRTVRNLTRRTKAYHHHQSWTKQLTFDGLLDQELISYRYSTCCSCSSSCWGRPRQKTQGSVVSNLIRMEFIRTVLHVNTRIN